MKLKKSCTYTNKIFMKFTHAIYIIDWYEYEIKKLLIIYISYLKLYFT
jgi:hypothetical protein